MPPRPKIFKEKILEAAFNLTREKGWENINARSLASKLSCSTQPIFRIYKDMAELKKDIFDYIEAFYNQYIESHIDPENIFFSIGMAYIGFAKEEPNLFKMLFMSNNFKTASFMEMLEDEENSAIADRIAAGNQITIENAKYLYMETWLFTHGIASMVATNSCSFQNNEIAQMLRNAFMGFLKLIKEVKENE
ncbi:TetR/AcrR family transcriptional regulator [Ruminiclostridium cellobioparum]|uniref:Uncharacterized protein n=1 Tax=Ruminiclostridium cellobioparum subsp. termitidis CT1112 TaxID=1195236 RepID=S0FUJ3_RUMCE|nr:TetR/AcrR family transcriptional regulator [Ruminiclostridium cellobioparum]EMS72203.1 hypothetical protein CTER_1899 [Ruminiclostridium cellobioparum subsp. termitidis CT1112]